MKIRISLHRFVSDSALRQRDGVNLAHSETNRLLLSLAPGQLQVEFHDFDRLIRDNAYALETLASVHCVLCNVGPHAHYYHFLRERLRLNFRIIRDVKAALWSGYLMQESLCAPYLRPGDAVLTPSAYTGLLLRKLFPHLSRHPIRVFEPVLAVGSQPPPQPRRPPTREAYTLGYVGRLSEDKNFHQVVDLLIELNRVEPGRYRLRACGAPHSPSCAPEEVALRIHRETGRRDLFDYLPPRSHEEVLDLYRTFDHFLFFSTSNVETLGRVVVEASACHVPVLAAGHAAMSELLAPHALLDVDYRTDQTFLTHFDAPLGTVDIHTAAERIRRSPRTPQTAAPMRVNQPSTLLELLLDGGDAEPDRFVGDSHGAMNFINRLSCEGLQALSDQESADQTVSVLRAWFCALNGKKAPDFQIKLTELLQLSRFPERTLRFVRDSHRTLCDFSNLGGLDMELCNVAAFHPQFRIAPTAQEGMGMQRQQQSSTCN